MRVETGVELESLESYGAGKIVSECARMVS